MQILATVIFAIAILHTFFAWKFLEIAHGIEKREGTSTVKGNLFHVLGEVEVVFGFWAAIFILLLALNVGSEGAIAYIESVDFTEPAFVFVIMAVAATRSIQNLATHGIDLTAKALSRIVPALSIHQSFYLVALTLGPLLGSFITEPAAMTVVALILEARFFKGRVSERFKYKTIALLFVNVSIGGVLTHFAAPPVVMVAKVWDWNASYMFTHFGWKAMIAVALNVGVTLYFLRKDFKLFTPPAVAKNESGARVPHWVTLVHIAFLFLVVATSHHMAVFMGVFLLFIGVMAITEPHQDPLQLRQSLLVGFFLGGLVLLGKPQSWWLSPLLSSLSEYPLYFGTTALTAITDNAALTYLGAQVKGLSEPLKYALVAGAVTGGGLTVIANAPNPAGYGILKDNFGPNGIRPGKLAMAAIVPTIIALLCFEIL